MKVVLFCGGLGLRIRDYSEAIPKPMVTIGSRPILWHLMKYYSHFGHNDFILCLGHQGNVIKEFFLNYNECMSNNFVIRQGGEVDLLSSDIGDWTITFVDSGAMSSIGERLRLVKPYLASEVTFLANYTDGLTDLHLPNLIEFHQERRAIATFLAVPANASFHAIQFADEGRVKRVSALAELEMWMNGGFFVLQREIFDYLHEGEELVLEPFDRLIAEGRLWSLKYTGFWSCMDTYKERQLLEERYGRSDIPWAVWNVSSRQTV